MDGKTSKLAGKSRQTCLLRRTLPSQLGVEVTDHIVLAPPGMAVLGLAFT